MARSEARIQFGIWRGLDDLSPQAKLLYLVVLTEPTINHCGVGALRTSRWARHAGLTAAETEKALAELAVEPHVLVDDDTEEVLVRTLIRNDGVAEQPYVLKGAIREALRTVSPMLRRVLAAELRKLPPRQPDRVGKNGRMTVYPDPHDAAARLDPGGPEGPSGGSPETLPKPFGDPSETLPENPSETLSEGFSGSPECEGFRNPSERLLGGGGGGGSSLTPVSTTQVSSVARTHAREVATPAALNRTARTAQAAHLAESYAATCGQRPPRKSLIRLAIEADDLLGQGWPADHIAQVIALWSTKPLGPAALQSVAQEWMNRSRAPAALTRSEQQFRALQALKTDPEHPPPPFHLRAIEGA